MNFLKFINNRGLRLSSIGSLSIKVIGALLAILISIAFVKILGPEGYGIYILVFSTIMLLSIPLTLGLPILIVRYIPQYEHEKNYAAINGLLIRSQQFVVISYLIIVLGILLFFLFFKNQFSSVFIETFIYGTILLLFMGLNAIRCALLEGLRYVVLGQLPDIVIRNLLLLLGVFISSFYFSLEPQTVMLIHVIAAVIAYLIGLLLLRSKQKKHLQKTPPVFFSKLWFRESLQFSFNMGVNNIKTRVATYVLAAISGTAAVAYFEIANKAANLVSFALTALNKSLAPHISKLYQEKNLKALQYKLKMASKYMFLFSVPLTLIFILKGEWIITKFYGEECLDAYVPLVIICLGQLINSFSGSVGLFLLMVNQQKFVLKVNVINTLAYIIISIILTYYFSIVGASIAFVLLLIIQNLIFVIYTKKKFNISTIAL